WFPIVKMEWITGQRLDEYVQQNLQRSDLLLRLSREWVAMVQALERVQVTHGDLSCSASLGNGVFPRRW
ncbi:MAG: hypothetical protein ACRD2Y_16700, partial [Terriglobales bacterium]